MVDIKTTTTTTKRTPADKNEIFQKKIHHVGIQTIQNETQKEKRPEKIEHP